MPMEKGPKPLYQNSYSKSGNALHRSEVFKSENTRCMLLLINAI
jgi:hypothetical protein